MAITIKQMKDPKFQKLRDLAIQVDNSFNGKTKGNKIIDDCEMSVFEAQVEANGLGNEYKEFLKQTSNTAEVVDSTDKKEKFNVDEAYTKLTRLEKNVQAAKAKVNNLREKLKELENTPNDRQKYQKTGGNIGAVTGGVAGFALTVATFGGAPAVVMAGLCFGVATACLGGDIGIKIGDAVYDMFKSDDEEKAYNDKLKNQIEKVMKDLKDAEQQLKKSELELQHFNNNI